jgi:hypothetical protein
MTSNQIIIDFERDYVPLSDELVYGANATKSAAPAEPLPTVASPVPDQTAAAQSAASETVQAPAKENTTTKISSIKDKVAASRARLAATKESLDKKTPDTNETASSNATNSTSSISA